jgi:hypothetical protein
MDLPLLPEVVAVMVVAGKEMVMAIVMPTMDLPLPLAAATSATAAGVVVVIRQ